VTPMNDDTAILSVLPAGQMPDADPEQEREDSLAEELAHAAPKRWWNRGTVVLAGLVLLAGGFVGGLQAQKHWGTATTAGGGGFAGAGGAAAGRYGGGAGRTGAGAYGFGGGGFGQGAGGTGQGGTGQGTGTGTGSGAAATAAAAGVTGTVKLVDGSTIYVQTSDGNVVTVDTTKKTAVAAASKSTLGSIKAGQTITVQGATGSDGKVAATSVTATK
jgi:hypothetical protein